MAPPCLLPGLPPIYHEMVGTLAQSVHRYILREQLFRPGNKVGLAVSGGADSVALLCLIAELGTQLGIVVSVIHFNHQLRPEAEQDEAFVQDLAARHGFEFLRGAGDAAAHAKDKKLSVETAARELRYEYFWNLLRTTDLNRLATAHTLDDQAETVILKLARGAGTKGLAGIFPRLPMDECPGPTPRAAETKMIVRPLLATSRQELETYLAERAQPWRDDRSNRDLRYARNVVRHGVLPRLARHLNPSIRQTLSETAEIARAEEEYWTTQLRDLLPGLWLPSGPPNFSGRLDLPRLLAQPLALQRRLVRAAGEELGLSLEFKHVAAVVDLARFPAQSRQSLSLPHGSYAQRDGDHIFISRLNSDDANQRSEANFSGYEYILPIPGRVDLREAGRTVEAIVVPQHLKANYDPDQSFSLRMLTKQLRIRNWRPGDRFWPGHNKSPKKIKELLQKLKVSGMDRKRWPVALRYRDLGNHGDEVIWMAGFPSPMMLRPEVQDKEVVIIRHKEL